MTSTATITVTTVNADDGQPVNIAPLVGFISMAEGAERTGRKPGAVHPARRGRAAHHRHVQRPAERPSDVGRRAGPTYGP